MKQLILATFFFLCLSNTFSCEIETFQNLVFLKKSNLKVDHVFKSTTCSDKINKSIIEYLSEAEGALDSNYLQKVFKNSFKIIFPQRITVRNLDDLLRSNLDFKKNYKWFTKTESKNQYTFGYDNEDVIKTLCHHCETTGIKNLQIIINRFDGNRHALWLRGKVLSSVTAFISKRDLPALHTINLLRDFKKEIYFTEHPQKFASSKDELVYSKLSRSINRGTAIQRNQIIPMKLVKAGAIVNLDLKHKSLRLSSKAAAISSGKLNDIIRVRNLKTGRIVQGKIVDFNKIEVEL